MLESSTTRHVFIFKILFLRATDGALNDDATALCVDWHGGPERERTSDSGADV